RKPLQKCDGIRPICGTCRNSNRGGDCEYADSSTRSSTHALEEKVSGLRARIREL
ncbi:hypothetical protein K488DRAFT_15551, partial [Vararia minispora EC-137]